MVPGPAAWLCAITYDMICTEICIRHRPKHIWPGIVKSLDVQVAEVMARVAEQVRDAQEEAERRAPILDALQEIGAMRAECAWLASYEKDDARFKVCTCLWGLHHPACWQPEDPLQAVS